MATTFPKTEYEKCPSGTHVAACYQVVELGTQQTPFKDDITGEPKYLPQVRLGFEIPAEKMKDGRAFTIQQTYTLSGGKNAALRKLLESWRGRPFTKEELSTFDIGKLVGVGCLLGIVHNGDYANISSILALPKGQVAPKSENYPVHFSLSEFDNATFESLSQAVRDKIEKSPEYGEIIRKASGGAPQSSERAVDEGYDDMVRDEENNNPPF